MKNKINSDGPCPCCSGSPYQTCCEPILQNHHKAVTAVALMRSRYTGFVEENREHLLKTWISKTRPANLNFEDHPVSWVSLTINKTIEGEATDNKGQVDFTSTYIENGKLCNLSEVSNFSKIDGLWYYVDGVCEVTQKSIERNRPCPCGSGKKFKRCCYI